MPPFPLHVNQISILPPPHILLKTVSQVTIPPRMLAIVPATFHSIPKPDSYYNFIEMSVHYKSQQNLFVVPVPKILVHTITSTPTCLQLYIQVPGDVILPKI